MLISYWTDKHIVITSALAKNGELRIEVVEHYSASGALPIVQHMRNCSPSLSLNSQNCFLMHYFSFKFCYSI
jgi:hypothetical protein